MQLPGKEITVNTYYSGLMQSVRSLLLKLTRHSTLWSLSALLLLPTTPQSHERPRFTATDATIELGKLTWIAQQTSDNTPACNGIAISNRHILLPAHCLETRANRTNPGTRINNLDEKQNVKILSYIVHPDNPDYQPGPTDITILETDQPIELSHYPVLDSTEYDCRQRMIHFNETYSSAYLHQQIKESAEQFLDKKAQKNARQLNASHYKVTIKALDKNIQLTRCRTPIQVEDISEVNYGRQLLKAHCPNHWDILVTGKIQIYVSALVTSKTVAKNHKISETEIRWQEIDINLLSSGFLTRPEHAIEKYAKAPIQIGTPITSRLLTRAPNKTGR